MSVETMERSELRDRGDRGVRPRRLDRGVVTLDVRTEDKELLRVTSLRLGLTMLDALSAAIQLLDKKTEEFRQPTAGERIASIVAGEAIL